jgi:hypothetical protein
MGKTQVPLRSDFRGDCHGTKIIIGYIARYRNQGVTWKSQVTYARFLEYGKLVLFISHWQ